MAECERLSEIAQRKTAILAQMTREDKIKLLKQLNGGAMVQTEKKSARAVSAVRGSSGMSPLKARRPQTAVKNKDKAPQRGVSAAQTGPKGMASTATPMRNKSPGKKPMNEIKSASTFASPSKPIKSPEDRKKVPKTENQNLCSLVHADDKLEHGEVIQLLTQVANAKGRIGEPQDDIGTIFNKIQAWKEGFGDLDQQEKAVAQKMKTKGVKIHNAKSLLKKLQSLQKEIKLTDDEIMIMIFTSLDFDWFTNLLVLAGQFTMWFNLNFEGESREEIDFRQNKEELWVKTCFQAEYVVNLYHQMSGQQEIILTEKWWAHARFQRFGIALKQSFAKNPTLMTELRSLFKGQKDKLSYFDLFQFIEHKLKIKLKNWEEDSIEGRLDRLGMAFIEFNEFNEFSKEHGIEWGEDLLETDMEDILDAKLNLSYKDYKLGEDDYFMGCKTILCSEKAALAKVNNIMRSYKRQGKTQYLDPDFGPRDPEDIEGIRFAMYKTGEPSRKGYPEPTKTLWEYMDKLKHAKGAKPQFVDDGVASDDCVQGTLGDCWFISATSVLATRDELLIGGRKGMEYDPDMIVDKEIASILDNGVYPPIFHKFRSIGLYVLRFFKNFQWLYVVTDMRIPVDKKTKLPVFGKCRNSHEMWVPLIEKAYAKLHGCYENLISGYVDEGIQELTGMQPEKIFIRDEKTGVFPHKMIKLNYGGADGFWDFLTQRDLDGCLLGCSIKGDKGGPQIIEGKPSGLIINHAYGINDIFELKDPWDLKKVIRLLRLRNPWGSSEWLGAWSGDSTEMKKYGEVIKATYINKLPPDEQFALDADDGTFLMHYDDWKDNFSTLFLNIDFPEDWTGVRFKSKWTKSNSAGLPTSYQKEPLEKFAKNPQFYIKPAYDAEVMISLTQIGGRLPVDGQYSDYPFSEQLNYAAVSIFELNPGQTILDKFDQNRLVFMSPIKRERENSGRCVLKAGKDKAYVVVCAPEIEGKKGDFYLSVYFNQQLRDVQLKRVFHPEDKQADKEEVLPYFIPEEAEKLVNQTPLWKIKLVKESLKYMMTDEDAGAPKDVEIDDVQEDQTSPREVKMNNFIADEGELRKPVSSRVKSSRPAQSGDQKGMIGLVNPKDKLTADQVVGYLNSLVTASKKIGDPLDDIEVIFNKIQAWKQTFGNLDEQEKEMVKKLKCKDLKVHNVKTLLEKLQELAGEIKLTNEEIFIIIYTSLDHDNFNNLLVQAGQFTMWFNLNFEGESREELDFKENKKEIWDATCYHAKQIVMVYKDMPNKEELLNQKWWENLRYSRFGKAMKDAFKLSPHLKSELRELFKIQNDKISYWNLFQFIEHQLKIMLNSWEEDALEGRLDRLGMAFIEFNEFNEFSIEHGIDWGEALLETDMEDILDAKLNLSYKDYQVTEDDYFCGCPTMLNSEKAALAKAEELFKRYAKKKGGAKYVDQDFGPKSPTDEVGGRMAMYKTGDIPRKGYQDPAKTDWVNIEDIIGKGETAQFVDDGVASDDCIQGTLGDCWFISALSVLATRDELLTGGRKGMEYDEDMIIDKEIASLLDNGVYPPIFHKYRSVGLYVLRFFKNFNWIYVIVDQRIPVNQKDKKPVFGKCRNLNEMWVPLIEKAYAKLHGCYENLMSGYVDEGIQELTGMQPEKVLIRDEKTLLFPHKMVSQNYGGAEGFWNFLLQRDNDGCLLGCSIKGYGKEGPQILEGMPTGLILNHAYGINDIFEFKDPRDQKKVFQLLRLRNPWGSSEWLGAWSGESREMKQYGAAIKSQYIDKLPPDEQFELDADDGTFLMLFEDWRDNFSTLFLNLDFPEDWTGVRFKSKWTKSNAAGLPAKYTMDARQKYARNPQFFIRPAYDTEIMVSMTQTGGRLPVQPGVYSTYPFQEQLHYGAVAIFECPPGKQLIDNFDTNKLKFLSPIKRERENSGRCKLEATKSYVIVCSSELEDKRGDFFLSVYYNQNLRDVQCKRVFHPEDKQAGKEQVLPYFIPEEAEKLSNQTPLWKIHLVKESLKFMMTDEDNAQAD